MQLKFHKYKIPFSQSFITAQKGFKYREGVILSFSKNGIIAMGEVAPLPGFSNETLPEVIDQILHLKPAINQVFTKDFTTDELEYFFDEFNIVPSLRFGLYTAAVSYLAQLNSTSMHHFFFNSSREEVRMNAVADLQKQNILASVQKYVHNGFTTVKIKVGNNWEQTLSKIKKIRTQYPDLPIRIDANRSWSLEEAKKHFRQVDLLNIEYCEEPLIEPSKESLSTLRSSTSTPIALDETMADWPDTKEMAEITEVFVIKPMVIGSEKEIESIIKFANENGKKVVFTTSLGTGIERLMTATLAAGFTSKTTIHGINTGNLLSADVWNDSRFIDNEMFILPNAKELRNIMQADLQKLPLQII